MEDIQVNNTLPNHSTGNTYSRLTTDVFDYHTFWMKTTKTNFVFKVRCCNDAHVLMATTMHRNDTDHAYEVVFGGGQNQRAFVRKGSSWTGAPGYEEWTDFPGLVDCDELRTFWTSWGDGLLQAGSGAVPLSHTLLTWQDPEPLDVEYLAVSTGWGSTGEWDITHDQSTHFAQSLSIPPLSYCQMLSSYHAMRFLIGDTS